MRSTATAEADLHAEISTSSNSERPVAAPEPVVIASASTTTTSETPEDGDNGRAEWQLRPIDIQLGPPRPKRERPVWTDRADLRRKGTQVDHRILRRSLAWLRGATAMNIKIAIRDELLEGQKVRSDFAYVEDDGKETLKVELLSDTPIEELVKKVDPEPAERVLEKWFGKTTVAQKFSQDVLGLMGWGELPEIKKFPVFLGEFYIIGSSAKATKFGIRHANQIFNLGFPTYDFLFRLPLNIDNKKCIEVAKHLIKLYAKRPRPKDVPFLRWFK